MDHLREIDDIGVQDAIDLFQTQMEVCIIDLLQEHSDTALAKIDQFRNRSLNHVKNLGYDFAPVADDLKAIRIAVVLLERTFERLRSTFGPAN
jgi:hypothetical protein